MKARWTRITPRSSLLNGHRVKEWPAWMGLDFRNAWPDPGPSPTGNPGPYLLVFEVVEGGYHRLYPKKAGMMPVKKKDGWFWVRRAT